MKLILVPVVAILCVTAVLIYTLYLGRNGLVLALGIGSISGLGGYEVKSLIDKIRGAKKVNAN